jgi:hypothetical protein
MYYKGLKAPFVQSPQISRIDLVLGAAQRLDPSAKTMQILCEATSQVASELRWGQNFPIAAKRLETKTIRYLKDIDRHFITQSHWACNEESKNPVPPETPDVCEW